MKNTRRISLVVTFAFGIAVVAFLLVLIAPVRAAGVVGNGTPASCTEAELGSAVAAGGAVTFNCGAAPDTILLSHAIAVQTSVDINGGDKITLSGGNTTRIFATLFGAHLDLHHIILTRGHASDNGGAIQQNTPMTLDHVTISNSASDTNGGAIYSQASPLTVNDSLFTGNRASNGGALYLDGSAGLVQVTNTVIRSNTANRVAEGSGHGGGILIGSSAQIEITGGSVMSNTAQAGGGIALDFPTSRLAIRGNALIKGNQAISAGGGIDVNNNGTATILDSVISDNTTENTGAGIYQNDGSIWLTRTQVLDNRSELHGGGILVSGVDATVNTNLYVRESTIAGNSAKASGGGIFLSLRSGLVMENSTVSGNVYANEGGGLYVYSESQAALSNVTISGNHTQNPDATQNGGGISFTNGVSMHGLTIANNSADDGGGIFRHGSDGGDFLSVAIVGNSPFDCNSWGLAPATYSLDTDGSCLLTGSTNHSDKNGNLGPLANNGGNIKTMLPLAGSDLIDAGVCTGLPTKDARGVSRPQGAACDIGAVESAAAPPPTNTPTRTSTPGPTNTPQNPTPTATPRAMPTATPAETPAAREYLPMIKN